jgi:hypothetical protein
LKEKGPFQTESKVSETIEFDALIVCRFLDERFEQGIQDSYFNLKPFSFFVVWLGSENLIFRKDYHRNNYNV